MAETAPKPQVDILVDDGYPPFSFEQDGAPAGIYIEVLKALIERLPDYDIRLQPVPWDRGKKMMETGSGFALAPAFFHGHDWPYLHPYSLPFYVETIRVMCQEPVLRDGRRRVWPQDFQNLSVGNVKGYDGWGGRAFREMIADRKISYFEAPTSRSLIKMGLAGRIDCLLMEETAFDIELARIRKTSNRRGMELLKGPVSNSDPVYVGYSRPAREQGKFPFRYDFMQALDSQIYLMQTSGEIRKIIEEHQLKLQN
ncbi:substrate-binding periplasmic protein [Roseibium sp.]|uniref:substrate-binding periplasmic protein n=1 Tax=Roseibium sp. TaxID=1936156 RepID=UPI003BAE6BCC